MYIAYLCSARTRPVNRTHRHAAGAGQICASCASKSLSHGFNIEVARCGERMLGALWAAHKFARRAHFDALHAARVAGRRRDAKTLTRDWRANGRRRSVQCRRGQRRQACQAYVLPRGRASQPSAMLRLHHVGERNKRQSPNVCRL